MENLIYKYRRLIAEVFIYVIITGIIIAAGRNIHRGRINSNRKAFIDYNYIYNDVNVNDTNLGGLTKEQAAEVLERQVQDVYSARELNIKNPITSEVYECNFGMCGADYDFEKAVESAYSYGRTGSFDENFNKVYKLKNVSYFMHAEYETNEETLSKLIDDIAGKVEDESGVKINRKLAVKAVKEIVDTGIKGEVVLPVEY